MASTTVSEAIHRAEWHHDQRLESIRIIRNALHLGLESFGEIERLIDEYETHRKCAGSLPTSLLPLHPTGSANTVGEFAAALRTLEAFEHEAVAAIEELRRQEKGLGNA